MSFEEVSRQFAQSESGTDSFKILFRRAFELMQEDAPNAALYFVIGIAAQAYVRRYEDEGVTSDFANETKKRSRRSTQKYCAACRPTRPRGWHWPAKWPMNTSTTSRIFDPRACIPVGKVISGKNPVRQAASERRNSDKHCRKMPRLRA